MLIKLVYKQYHDEKFQRTQEIFTRFTRNRLIYPYFLYLFCSRGNGRPCDYAARLARCHWAGTRATRLYGTPRRQTHAMEPLYVQRNAIVPNVAHLQFQQTARFSEKSIPTVFAQLRVLGFHHVAGVLYSDASFQSFAAHKRVGRDYVGVFVVLFHHHCRRAYLEIYHAGVYSAHHRGIDLRVPKKVPVGRIADYDFCGLSDFSQSYSDELLFLLLDVFYGSGLRRASRSRKQIARFFEIDRCNCGCRPCWRVGQFLQSVSHVGIFQGNDARQIRIVASRSRK